MRRVVPPTIGLACAAILGVGLVGVASGGDAGRAHGEARVAGCAWPQGAFPSRERVRRAAAYAAERGVAFAVMDGCGGVRGYDVRRRFSSASIAKALLLPAYLRQRGEAPIPEADKALLRAMITASDNGAANSLYDRVGDAGLAAVARRAGMADFEVTPGFWGGAQVTAADMARFFFRLEANIPPPHRAYGMTLLASVIGPQRWGIPAAADGRWRVWFKGGWRPAGAEQTSGAVTHQAALLLHPTGLRLSIAVLTDQAPGGTSFETIEGIARILLDPAPRPATWVPA